MRFREEVGVGVGKGREIWELWWALVVVERGTVAVPDLDPHLKRISFEEGVHSDHPDRDSQVDLREVELDLKWISVEVPTHWKYPLVELIHR